MADARGAVTGRPVAGAAAAPLNIVALAPLPFLQNDSPSFAGGGTIFYVELLPRLARLGHRIRVIADAPPAVRGTQRSGLASDSPNLFVEWFAYEHRSSLKPPTPAFRKRTSAQIQRVFERFVAEQRPDAVLIGREVVSLYMLGLCQQYGLPTVLISHGVAIAALLRGVYPSGLARELVEHLQQIDAVVAVASHIEDMLRRLGVTRVQTIRNIADPTTFRPQPKDAALLQALRIAPAQPVVGHVSVLRPAKRTADIVDSAALVLRARPDVVYLVVGDGPCRGDVEERARQRGLLSRFRFVGEVAHEQVPRYVNLCDLVLLPSEREGLALACLEIQACGRVILASDIPGAREAIVDGETGVLFPTGDVSVLAAETVRLIEDRALLEAIAGRARAAAEQRMPSQWLEGYTDVLRRVASRESDPSDRRRKRRLARSEKTALAHVASQSVRSG